MISAINKPTNEPELICKDLRFVNYNIKTSNQKSRCNDEDSLGDYTNKINLSDEFKKELKALGGPMFSIEENEKLKRDKMRGGYFKEKSSESSNDNSDPDSPNRVICGNSNISSSSLAAEEKKLLNEKIELNNRGNRKNKKNKK